MQHDGGCDPGEAQETGHRPSKAVGDLPQLLTARLGLGGNALSLYLPSLLDAILPARRLTELTLCLDSPGGEEEPGEVDPGVELMRAIVQTRVERSVLWLGSPIDSFPDCHAWSGA